MTDEINPALTAEEWETHLSLGLPVDPNSEREEYGYPHAIAACLLYGQPFGFTREDVKAIEYGVSAVSSNCQEMCSGDCSCSADAARLRAVAERISALLPPDEVKDG